MGLRLYRLEAGRFASRLQARPKRMKSSLPTRWHGDPNPPSSSHLDRPDDQPRPRSEGHPDVLQVAAWKAGDFRSQGWTLMSIILCDAEPTPLHIARRDGVLRFRRILDRGSVDRSDWASQDNAMAVVQTALEGYQG